MATPFLTGNRLYLRPLDHADIENLVRWFHDPEVNRNLLFGHRPMTQKGEEEWIRRANESETDMSLVICLKEGDRPIGTVGAHGMNFVHRYALIGIMIGEKDQWSKGYGTEALGLLIDHLFKKMNLRRIELEVFEDNPRAMKSYQKLGFVEEGHSREKYYKEGRYVTTINMGLLRDDE